MTRPSPAALQASSVAAVSMTAWPFSFLAHDEVRDAAAGVAAGGDLAAVGVEDAHADVGDRLRGRRHDDQLVAADAGAAVGDDANDRGRQIDRRLPRVEDDEIVAEAVHLDEGQGGHRAPNMAQAPPKSTRVTIGLPECGRSPDAAQRNPG